MARIREVFLNFYQNNKRGFVFLGVLIILLSIHLLTKPKKKIQTEVNLPQQEEVLPPVSSQEKDLPPVDVSAAQTQIQSQSQMSLIDNKINNNTLSLSSQQTSSVPQKSVISQPANKLISDISKYSLGKIDPYKPLISKTKKPQFSEGNFDIKGLPWPDDKEETQKPLRVTGILFDKKEPVAVLEGEGKDFIVKKGDDVLDYKVVSISDKIVVLEKEKTQKILKID